MGMVLYLRRASAADIDQVKGHPDQLDDFMFDEADASDDLVDLDKAWHGVHYLLTGSADATDSPLSLLIGNWESFGQNQHGFGGGWIVPPPAMQAFHTALAALDDETLTARYDPAAMNAEQVYLADAFVEESPEEALEYILQGLPNLRRFAARCASSDTGAIIVLQ